MVSIATGGEALNLTMANRCIIYDPWWHGAVEEQAFGRMRSVHASDVEALALKQVRDLADGRWSIAGTYIVRLRHLRKWKWRAP